jgi:hypothetical protein
MFNLQIIAKKQITTLKVLLSTFLFEVTIYFCSSLDNKAE